MSELTSREQAIYLFALRLIAGIGPKNVLAIARAFPQLHIIPELSLMELKGKLGDTLAQKLHQGLTQQWKSIFPTAEKTIDQHLAKKVQPLPITSDEYPVLLKQIEDPPAILYMKGDLSALNNTLAVAVVGTREPTMRGIDTARRVAALYAQHGYVIVSGLAKGIDTAAHLGTIAAGGKTIAVFATPLDKVYPAENRKLAEQIAEEAGVLVSELPFGTVSWKGAFVERDRIQSGLSLGVIPVQTGIEGGTMHTIRFAQAQKRLLLCPVPAEEEKQAPQYEGVWWLLKQKKACYFRMDQPNTYEPLLRRLDDTRRKMLPDRVGAVAQQTALTIQQREAIEQPISTTPRQPAEGALRIVQQTLETVMQSPEAMVQPQSVSMNRQPVANGMEQRSLEPKEQSAATSPQTEQREQSQGIAVEQPILIEEPLSEVTVLKPMEKRKGASKSTKSPRSTKQAISKPKGERSAKSAQSTPDATAKQDAGPLASIWATPQPDS